MRLAIHKVKLKGGTEPIKAIDITIATTDMARIPTIVEAHRHFYTAILKEPVKGFEVVDTQYTFNLDDDKYAETMMMVDIVDEDTTQYVPKNV